MVIWRQNESQATTAQLIGDESRVSRNHTIIILSFVLLFSIEIAFWSTIYFLADYPETAPIFGCSFLRNFQYFVYFIFLFCFLFLSIKELENGIIPLLAVKSIQVPISGINVFSLILYGSYVEPNSKMRLYVSIGIMIFSIVSCLIAVSLCICLKRSSKYILENLPAPKMENKVSCKNKQRPLPTPPSMESENYDAVAESHTYVNLERFKKNSIPSKLECKTSGINDVWSMDEEENIDYDTDSDEEPMYDIPRTLDQS